MSVADFSRTSRSRALALRSTSDTLSLGVILAFFYGALLPFEYVTLPIIRTIGTVMNGILFVIVLTSGIGVGKRFALSLSVFVFFSGLSIGWSDSASAGITKLIRIMLLVVMFMVISRLAASERRGLVLGLSVGTAVASSLLLLGLTGQIREFSGRIYAYGQNENDLAGLFLLVALVALAGALLGRHRFANLVLYALSGGSILLTGSRSGFGSLIFGSGLLLLVSLRRNSLRSYSESVVNRRLRKALLVAVTALMMAPLILPGIGGRSSTFLSTARNDAVGGRTEAWTSQAGQLSDPLVLIFGAGLADFSVDPGDGSLVVTHNTPLNVLVESGLFAFAALLALWAKVLKVGRSRERAVDFTWCALSAILLMSMSLNWIDRRVLWMALALTASSELLRDRRKS